MHCISLVVLFIAATMASASSNSEKPVYNLAEADKHFEDFITAHKRTYKDDEDRKVHFEAFKANLEKINKLNKADPSATYGINELADYTVEEMKAMRGLKRN